MEPEKCSSLDLEILKKTIKKCEKTKFDFLQKTKQANNYNQIIGNNLDRQCCNDFSADRLTGDSENFPLQGETESFDSVKNIEKSLRSKSQHS